jgi:hypothetical protein
MGTNAAPASTADAMDMVLGGLSYLASSDPAALAVQAQADCLRAFERADAISTAARAWFLAAFTAGPGYGDDADYSPTAWLIHRTGVTKGAARGHVGWARRTAAHPAVVMALAEGTIVSESMARLICGWSDRLPADCRAAADEILLAAARAGASRPDLAALAAEIYARSRPGRDDDPEPAFEDRQLTVETTFGGAGVITGDLTPGCAAIVTAVLDSLSAPAGAADTRTREQRYHDALEEAMRRLVASGLLPDRAGQPVKALVHVSLAELRARDDGSVLETVWITEMQIRWAARRAEAADGHGGDGGAWLDGDDARAAACDAPLTPVVTGHVNIAVLDDLVRLCAQLAGHGLHRAAKAAQDPQSSPSSAAEDPHDGPASAAADPSSTSAPAEPLTGLDHLSTMSREALERAIIGKAVDLLSGPGGLASFLRTRQLGGRLAGPSLPLDIGVSSTIPAGIRTAVILRTANAGGRAAVISPLPPARSTTSGTRPAAGPPAWPAASCCAPSTIRSSSTGKAGPSSSTRTAPPPPGTPAGPRSCTATPRPPAPGETRL